MHFTQLQDVYIDGATTGELFMYSFDSSGNPAGAMLPSGMQADGSGALTAVSLTTTGAIAAGTTVTAGTGVTATTGGVTATAGGVTATAGDITATAGDIVATAGDVVITAGDLIVTTPTTPATAAATGTIGTIAWDTGYLYVCTATDTWERVAIATW